MEFYTLIEIFKERMAGANPLLVIILSFLALVILTLAIARWGSGFFLAFTFILSGLLLTKSRTYG
jgi:fatty acid desaturase